MLSSFNKSVSRSLSDRFPVLYQNRFCDQKEFSIAVFSGEINDENVRLNKPFLLRNFNTKDSLPIKFGKSYETISCSARTFKKFNKFKVVCNGASIYIVNQHIQDDTTSFGIEFSTSVIMYSFANKRWKKLPTVIEEKSAYCVCSFMQKLFLLGDSDSHLVMFYDIQTNKWTTIASMIESRVNAACTVFEGKIVLSGGLITVEREMWLRSMPPQRYTRLVKTKTSSVEAYDHHENKWYYFPEMLSPKNNHSSVSINNKMFMIGSSSDYCEVFDSVTRKFTYIKFLTEWIRTLKPFQEVSIGHEIYFFRKDDNKVYVNSYDVKNNFLRFRTSIEMENFNEISCIKIPMK